MGLVEGARGCRLRSVPGLQDGGLCFGGLLGVTWVGVPGLVHGGPCCSLVAAKQQNPPPQGWVPRAAHGSYRRGRRARAGSQTFITSRLHFHVQGWVLLLLLFSLMSYCWIFLVCMFMFLFFFSCFFLHIFWKHKVAFFVGFFSVFLSIPGRYHWFSSHRFQGWLYFIKI